MRKIHNHYTPPSKTLFDEVTEEDFQSWLKRKADEKRVERVKRKHYDCFPLPTNYCVDGEYDFPLLKAEILSEGIDFIPIRSGIKQGLYTYAIHGMGYDNLAKSFYNQPFVWLDRLNGFKVIIPPAHSCFVGDKKWLNIANIGKNLCICRFLQEYGKVVIPQYSYSDENSLKYCTKGMPYGGTIAIEHISKGRNRFQRQLTERAVKRLVEEKEPCLLIVCGERYDFNPGVPVKYIESHLSKLKKL